MIENLGVLAGASAAVLDHEVLDIHEESHN